MGDPKEDISRIAYIVRTVKLGLASGQTLLKATYNDARMYPTFSMKPFAVFHCTVCV